MSRLNKAQLDGAREGLDRARNTLPIDKGSLNYERIVNAIAALTAAVDHAEQDAEAENACGCDCKPLDGAADEAAFFAEIDKRLAELAAIDDRMRNDGPAASYWIDGVGRIRDVEIHGAPVDFVLAANIAVHNAERNAE